jgi:peptidoglycan/LPS O-acetylase OafA/YrhL
MKNPHARSQAVGYRGALQKEQFTQMQAVRIHKTRLLELDGIRGIAISAVFLFHLSQFSHQINGTLFGKIVIAACDLGWVGVDLFFVLSGFLITSILLDTKDTPGYFKNFYARRLLRIFPLYYLILASVAVLFLAFPGMRTWYGDVYSSQAWYWADLQNWLSAAHSGAAFNPGFLGHFWSLAIEEQFYLFWPFLVWCLDRRSLLAVCTGLVVLPLGIRLAVACVDTSNAAQQLLYFSTVTRFDSLAMGAIVAICLGIEIPKFRLRFYSMVIGVPSLVALAFIVTHGPRDFWGNLPLETIGLTFTGAASVALVLYGLGGAFFLKWTVLRTIGKYSYALYIFHLPVLMITSSLLMRTKVNGISFVIALAAVATSATFTLAYLSWHFVEKRFLAQKARFDFAKPT